MLRITVAIGIPDKRTSIFSEQVLRIKKTADRGSDIMDPVLLSSWVYCTLATENKSCAVVTAYREIFTIWDNKAST